MKKIALAILGVFVALALIGVVVDAMSPSQDAAQPQSASPAKVDPIASLIAKRYAECVPGLEAEKIQRVSPARYTWSSPDHDWILAWSIGARNSKTGEPFTPPTDDSLSQFEKLGCV